MAVNYGPCLLTLREGSRPSKPSDGPCLLTLREEARPSKPSARGSFSLSPTWSLRPTTRCGARSTCLWVHRNLFWQLSRGGSFHGSGMAHATTASPKPSFTAPWRVGDAVVGRGNAGLDNIKEWTSLPSPELLTGVSCKKRLEEDLR